MGVKGFLVGRVVTFFDAATLITRPLSGVPGKKLCFLPKFSPEVTSVSPGLQTALHMRCNMHVSRWYHTHTYIYIYIYIYTETHAHAYMHTYIYTYTYTIYIYIHIHITTYIHPKQLKYPIAPTPPHAPPSPGMGWDGGGVVFGLLEVYL